MDHGELKKEYTGLISGPYIGISPLVRALDKSEALDLKPLNPQ